MTILSCMHVVKLLQACPALCDPMDCCPPGSYVHGILQTSILEWVAMPFSRGSSQPRDQTWVLMSFTSSALACRLFTTSAILEAHLAIYVTLTKYILLYVLP